VPQPNSEHAERGRVGVGDSAITPEQEDAVADALEHGAGQAPDAREMRSAPIDDHEEEDTPERDEGPALRRLEAPDHEGILDDPVEEDVREDHPRETGEHEERSDAQSQGLRRMPSPQQAGQRARCLLAELPHEHVARWSGRVGHSSPFAARTMPTGEIASARPSRPVLALLPRVEGDPSGGSEGAVRAHVDEEPDTPCPRVAPMRAERERRGSRMPVRVRKCGPPGCALTAYGGSRDILAYRDGEG